MYDILTITFVQSSFHVLAAASVGIFFFVHYSGIRPNATFSLSLSVFCNLCRY